MTSFWFKNTSEMQDEDLKLLQELFEDNDRTIREVDKNFQQQKDKVKEKK